MNIHPSAGQPAARDMLVNVPRLVSAYYTRQPDPADPAQQVAFGTSGHRGIFAEGQLQRRPHPGHLPGRLRASDRCRASPARCTWAWTPTPCPSRRTPPPSRCSPPTASISSSRRAGLHAHAGHLPRHPGLQPRPDERPGRRRGDHAIAQPARRRRLQVQPAQRRPGRHRHHQGRSRTGPTRSWRTACAKSNGCRWRRPSKADTTHDYDYVTPYVHDLAQRGRHARPSRRPGSRSAWIRWAGPAWPTGTRSPRRTGSTSTVVNRRGRPDLLVHDRRLGRQDPHGLLFALRHGRPDRPQGQVRHRLRQRSGLRPPRHRHASAGSDEPQPLPGRRDLVLFQHRPGWGARRGRGQDAGLQLHDRPGGRLPGPATCARCRSASSGSWMACSTARSALAARKAPGRPSCASDGTVWTTDKDGIILDLLAAEITAITGRDPGETLPGPGASASATRSTSASTCPPRQSRSTCWQNLSPEHGGCRRTGRRTDHRQADPRPGQRRARSAA